MLQNMLMPEPDGTGTREISLVQKCSGTALRKRMPEWRYRRHRSLCQCPAMQLMSMVALGNSLSLEGHFADIAKTLSASLFNDDLLPKCSGFNMLTDEGATSKNRHAWRSPSYCVFMKSLHQRWICLMTEELRCLVLARMNVHNGKKKTFFVAF